MAHKEFSTSKKRKAVPSAGQNDGIAKKVKVGSLRKPFSRDEASDESDSDDALGGFSGGDGDEGQLSEKRAKKPLANGKGAYAKTRPVDKASNDSAPKAKVFEKGEPRIIRLSRATKS
jgi:hypothetical protein